MHSLKFVLAAFAATTVHAYKNNCDGSFYQPDINNCLTAIDDINAGISYSDGAQFSNKNCYIVYATNGSGPEPVSGQLIADTANDILRHCNGHGSFGTNNAGCSNCHVTINYRKAP